MSTNPTDALHLLPHGEMLRSYLLQSLLPKGELDSVLRRRGVFASTSDKSVTIPILTATLLSPDEFQCIRETFRAREDTPKTITQTIAWNSAATLLDSVPDSIWAGIEEEFENANFQIRKREEFFPVDGNADHLQLHFEIERKDTSKNWVQSESIHSGSVEIKKIVDGGRVKLAISYTAEETESVARKASSRAIEHFKSTGCVKPEGQVDKILFSVFSNEARIRFMLNLVMRSTFRHLTFKEMVDMSISPLAADEMPVSMSWIEEQMTDVRFRGSNLHTTKLIEDVECHSFVEMYSVVAKFDFDVNGATGTCCVSVVFPEYGSKRDQQTELVVIIDNVSVHSKGGNCTIAMIKSALNDELQDKLVEAFDRHGLAIVRDQQGRSAR